MQCVKKSGRKTWSRISECVRTQQKRKGDGHKAHAYITRTAYSMLVSQDRYDTINAHKQQITSCAAFRVSEQMYNGNQRQRRLRLSNRHTAQRHIRHHSHTRSTLSTTTTTKKESFSELMNAHGRINLTGDSTGSAGTFRSIATSMYTTHFSLGESEDMRPLFVC